MGKDEQEAGALARARAASIAQRAQLAHIESGDD